jgi:hypothetical protein
LNEHCGAIPCDAVDILEVDGKFKSEYENSEAALKVGLELKKKYPHIQVKVYDAKERTWTPVELSEQS